MIMGSSGALLDIFGAGFCFMHTPVMLKEVLAALEPRDGGVYVDGTFGGGGYTKAILDSADCTVYAIDRDPDAIDRARKLAEKYPRRLIPVHDSFGHLKDIVTRLNLPKLDGIVLDLGVSSFQIDEAVRGFSFQKDGPLDMRMEKEGPSAADIVNRESEENLADIIYTFGEEKASRKIAHLIVKARSQKPITTTGELAAIVHKAFPVRGKIDNATRTFQALRIYVNDELGEIDRVLDAAEKALAVGGRLVVVSFHSLEDGRIKDFLRERSGVAAQPSRHLPAPKPPFPPSFMLAKPEVVRTSDEEAASNPRARSARLRLGVRTDAPAWGAAA